MIRKLTERYQYNILEIVEQSKNICADAGTCEIFKKTRHDFAWQSALEQFCKNNWKAQPILKGWTALSGHITENFGTMRQSFNTALGGRARFMLIGYRGRKAFLNLTQRKKHRYTKQKPEKAE